MYPNVQSVTVFDTKRLMGFKCCTWRKTSALHACIEELRLLHMMKSLISLFLTFLLIHIKGL